MILANGTMGLGKGQFVKQKQNSLKLSRRLSMVSYNDAPLELMTLQLFRFVTANCFVYLLP